MTNPIHLLCNFSKQRKERYKQIQIEQGDSIREEESTAMPISMKTILSVAMIQFMKEVEEISKMALTSPSKELNMTLEELAEAGLGNTQNAKMLNANAKAHRDRQTRIELANEIVSYVKAIKRLFGDSSFLLPLNKFKEICLEYNLAISLLDKYNGVVPQKNVEEICRASKTVRTINGCYRGHDWEDDSNVICHLNCCGHDCSDDVRLAYVDSLEFGITPVDRQEIVTNYVENNNGLIWVTHHTNGYWNTENVIGLRDKFDRSMGSCSLLGRYVTNKEMLIACPKEFLNNPEIKVSDRPVDPIVFQYCPYGVLVHSVWGEEAEDKIIQEYMECNSKILNK